MNLIQLKYAIKAAEYNSISKAAEKLFTSQASCSNAISNLERELNVSIFERTNKGVKLTEKGEAFIAQAKIILTQAKLLEQIGENNIKSIRTLNISSHRVLFLSNVIIELYNLFKNENIKITLNEASRDVVIKNIKDKINDLGLIALNNVEDKFWKHIINSTGLEFNEIKREKLYIYVGEHHPLYNNKIITSDQLRDFTGIFLPERSNITEFNHIPSNEMLIKVCKRSFCINDKDTIIKVVRNTTAFVIGMRLTDEEKPEGLRGIPLDNDDIYFTIGWIKRKDEKLSNEEKAFISLL